MEELAFLEPRWLLALCAIPVIYLFLRRSEEVRVARLAQLGIQRGVRKLLWRSVIILLVLSIIALSRPYYGYREFSVSKSGADVAIVLDVSRSMLARDVAPTRLEAAKRKIFDLLELLRVEGSGERVGLVLFSGQSYLFCPFTSDYGVVRLFAKQASPDLITAQGSALQDALRTAKESFERVGATSRRVLLLSDGEDLEFSMSEAIAIISTGKLRLDALGFGTTEGSPIELSPGRFLKDRSGEVVLTKMDESNLQGLAEAGGGHYRVARIDDADLRRLWALPMHASSGKSRGNEVYRSYNELGPYLLFVAAAYVLMLMVARRAPSLFFLALCFAPYSLATAEPHSRRGYLGSRAYDAGDFDLAITEFKEGLSYHENSPRLLHGLGASLFRKGKFNESASVFQKLAETGQTNREKFEGHYNSGNAKFALKDFAGAIESYDHALEINPRDEASLFNRELARKNLEQQKNKKEDKKEEGKSDEQQQEPQQSASDQEHKGQDSPAPSPSATPGATSEQEKPEGGEESKQSDQGSPEEKEQKQDENSGKPEKKGDGEPQHEGVDPNQSGTEGLESDEDLQPQHENSAREAQAWLESQPEAPLLLHRKTGKGTASNGQNW